MTTRCLLLLPAFAACAVARPAQSGDDDVAPPADAAAVVPGAPDGAPEVPPDGAPPPSDAVAPLLLTEVLLAPSAAEFIEIANPTHATVDLSDYYLSDAGTYFHLPAGDAAVAASDFIARFPAGATLASGQVAVVALDTAASFQTATGVAPNWSIASGTMTLVAGSAATLTNTGELIVLFHWDGSADLVTDVDVMLAGAPTTGNGLVVKSAVALDGPDAGTQSSAYHADADTIGGQASAPASGLSTKRILLETGHETAAGGNGPDGADETSEQTGATWDSTFTAPTPGTTTLALP